jgi:hypothetical protein
MALSFSRTTRTLTNDTFRPSIVGLVIAILVLAIWGAWFALARAPVYMTGTDAQLDREGQVIAHFTDATLPQIRPGQEAVVLESTSGEPRRAQVMEIANRAENRMEPNTVRLFVFGSPLAQPPKQIQVQVAEESPLVSLLRLGTKVQLPQMHAVNQ